MVKSQPQSQTGSLGAALKLAAQREDQYRNAKAASVRKSK